MKGMSVVLFFFLRVADQGMFIICVISNLYNFSKLNVTNYSFKMFVNLRIIMGMFIIL